MIERLPPIRAVSRNGLVYERRGSGRAVIMLHGWCLNRSLWTYAEEAFAPDYEVILPDLAGFGQSSGLGGPYGFDRHAEDIGALIDELKLKSVVLIGFAFGAAVAFALAGASDRIAGVVAVGTPGRENSPYDRMPKSMRRDWPDFCRRSAKALFHNLQSEATLSWIEQMFRGTRLPVAIETVKLLGMLDPVGMAAKVKAPQLFVHATNDEVAPRAIGDACAANAPDARVEMIENCGHAIVLDQKERFHEVAGGFLKTIQ
jgi:pimeloyl-ACP methyl ester carboxylesterase